MFPGDENTSGCTINQDFTEFLREWEHTSEGMDFHTGLHLLHTILFQFRQMFTPLQMIAVTFNLIQGIEETLEGNNYKAEYSPGDVRLYDTPELRQIIEEQLDGTEIPDSVPEDWMTEGEDE